MLCPERDEIRLGFHKCLGAQEAHVAPRMKSTPLRLPQVSQPRGGPSCAQSDVKIAKAFTRVPVFKGPTSRGQWDLALR